MLGPGHTVGRYRLLRELGRGGMGVVYEAVHVELDSHVAVKVVDSALPAHDATEASRFLREARAAAQARHFHAVTVFDVGTQDGLSFIVMELLEGEPLADLFGREAPLIAPRIADLFLPILSAVAAAHDAGVVHRDLKPSNVMLARRGGRIVHPVVTDFGISKVLTADDGDRLTASHAVLGTIHYMAPELTRAAREATPQSDQYSLGVMLYEAATGKRPFAGAGPYELMHAIVTGNFPRPREINPELDPELEAILLRAMHGDPKRRYPTVRALGAELLSFGSAKTWALWAPEFAVGEGVEPTLTDAKVERDLSRASSRSGHFRAHGRRRKLWAAAQALGLFAAGVLVTRLLFVRTAVSSAASVTSAGSSGVVASTAGATAVRPPETVPIPSPSAVATVAAAPSSSALAIGPSAARPASAEPTPPPAAAPVAARRRGAVSATSGSGAAAGSQGKTGARESSSPEIGTNDALILK